MAIVQVPISKSGGRKVSVDTKDLPDEIYSLALYEGLKVFLNARMSKITTAKLEGEALAEAHEAAFAKAEENLGMLLAGKATKAERGSTAKADGVSREVMTEALRLAKAIVKDEIRNAGLRPSMVPAAEITAYAKQVLEADASLIDKAKETIAARAGVKPKLQLNFAEDPKLVAKAEKAKAEKKAASGTISAKQAGRVVPRRSGPKPGRETHSVQ